MPRKPTYVPPASPIPGVLPEPVRVQSDPDAGAGADRPPKASPPAASPGPRLPGFLTRLIARARRR